MEIVPFTIEDQKITQNFMEVIFEEQGWIPEPADGLDDIAALFHLPKNGFLFLVKHNGTIVGTGGCIKLNKEDYLLKRFYIKKDLRGKGLSQKLLNKIISTAKNWQSSKIVLDVSKNNNRAIHFYEKMGFVSYPQSPVTGWPESSTPETHSYYYLDIKNK